jgi:hypothetical protein
MINLSQAEEMVDSWINGNKNFIIDELLKLDKLEFTQTSFYIYNELMEYDTKNFSNYHSSFYNRIINLE